MMTARLITTNFFFLFAICCTAPIAVADFVIDDFTNHTFFATNQPTGDSTVPVVNAFRDGIRSTTAITNTAGVLSFPSGTTQRAYVEFYYDSFNVLGGIIDFSVVDAFLQLNYIKGTGGYEVSVILEDAFLPDFQATLNTPQSGSEVVFSEATSTGLSAYMNVTAIRIRVEKKSNNANTFQFTRLFSSEGTTTEIPEPATMWLFGLTGIAGVLVHRRRQRRKSAASDELAG